MNRKHTSLVIVIALLLGGAAGCASEDDRQDEPEQGQTSAQTSDGQPSTDTGQSTSTAPPADTTKRISELNSGCSACGPLPDPWRALAGPLPDPWKPPVATTTGTGSTTAHK